MDNDKDIKIAGDKPSENIKRNISEENITSEEISQRHAFAVKAAALGQALAVEVRLAEEKYSFGFSVADTVDIRLQKRILLAFAVAVGLEKYCVNQFCARTALNIFYDTLKRTDSEFYEDLNTTGAFSFYYLALRRGIDVERRIGQTFAMLCAKDGDGVYQELGEALYCSFMSSVKKQIDLHHLFR